MTTTLCFADIIPGIERRNARSTPAERDGALETGMADGVAVGYDRLDEILASAASKIIDPVHICHVDGRFTEGAVRARWIGRSVGR